jgi:allene oxide cyclase-like protein
MFSAGTAKRMPHAVAALIAAGLVIGGITACSSAGPQSDAAAAAGVSASSAGTSTATTTLSFIATDIDGNHVTIDLGHKNPGKPDIGDLVAFTQNLATDGKNVGQVHVIAAVVDHKQHLSEATGTIVLKDGTIQLAGVVSMEPKFTLTVTGGTGKYLGATGTMAFDASGNDQTMTVELH